MADSKVTLKYVAIGATVLALGFGISTLLSDEPPIKVRGGSLDIEICSNSASWDDGEDDWKLNSSANYSSEYDFEIAVGNHCGSSGPPPDKVREVHIDAGGTSVQLKRHRSVHHLFKYKTKVWPKGEFEKVDPRILTNRNPRDVKITVKPGYGNKPEWTCTFPTDQFQELWLNKGTATSCP